ncbi:tRNA (adenosine(37)-N6)-threonylcarbamoyltransferase complex transferase subunit TsaD [Membranicola marinus]|uniref:tRNA N6-adenosine threonylcarbamoyltransferase n=1 Tax=Membranihabitans marinus TaxID=1227546 RepID=A0A953I2T1_9BACT|nr:tRNA (adenosine(37)-N6)-threonylcarbamoyltransferase complex transferase subunit TsaD [Membranihabitans marinus]MBY5960182.1 tRNA (adenosine(37)-N6)-threonylcarbamoyltransferase complex transferase subunit TsaD [Membranihabitans marinus]
MSETLLAIESSCDDTGASIIIDAEIASNVVSSQIDHQNLGGVVPELASRKHMESIGWVVEEAVKNARIEKKDIDAIAFTRGPGLMGSLLVGVSFAKSMAQALDIPIIEVNHMEAHILSHFIDDPVPDFPFLCLTVSGGHTQIVKVFDYNKMEVLGQTLDDAAGEAFDKAGKIMGLPYPAGPHIDRLAQKGQAVFPLPHPTVDKYHFSFSGLKTAFLYFLQKEMKKDPGFIDNNIHDLAASLQSTIVHILLKELKQTSQDTSINEIAIAGGVSANSALRSQLSKVGAELGWNVYIPKLEYCIDNAAMIAQAAWFKYLHQEFSSFNITADPRLKV